MIVPPRARQHYGNRSHSEEPISLPVPRRKSKVRHPGYPHDANIRVKLSACDETNVIDYQTTHVACAIVSQNRWDGYISPDKEGTRRVESLSADESLKAPEHHFHVPKVNFEHCLRPCSLPNVKQSKITQLYLPSQTSRFLTMTCLLAGRANQKDSVSLKIYCRGS